MNRHKILSIALTITFIISSVNAFVLMAPSKASAFPSHSPQASDYIFYDDFERTGVARYPEWNSNAVYTCPMVSDQHYHGAKSLDMGSHDANSRQILRGFTNDTPSINYGIVVETMFYDNASVTSGFPEVRAQLWLANSAGSWIGLGIALNTTLGQRMYSYWASDGGGAYHYQATGIQRTTGWHDLKIMLVSKTVYSYYVDDNFVGTISLADSSGMEWYGFNVLGTYPDVPGNFYIDQFLVYHSWQDQLWKKEGVAIYNDHGFDAYAALEPNVIFEGGVFKMWYDGQATVGGYGYLGYATSTDGINWTNYVGGSLVNMSTGYRPFVTKVDSTYYLYYTVETGTYGQKHYAMRTSADGISWSAKVDTNLGCSHTEGAWDHKLLGNLDVWYENSTWYALYEAGSNATLWTIGLATSIDGITWVKYAGNPVMPVDWTGGNPEVHKIGETYYMFAHGLLTSWVNNVPTDIYLFQSTNLTTWTPCSFFSQYVRQFNYWGETYQAADMSYYEGLGQYFMAYTGTKNGSDAARIYIAKSSYSLAQIAHGDVLQWGTHFMDGIGVTNNVTASGKYWYSGINAMKGAYTDNFSVNASSDVNITITARSNVSLAWTADSGTGAPVANYSFSGLEAGRVYYIAVDGSLFKVMTSTDNGTLAFSYSGSSTPHVFTVDLTMVNSFGTLWNILPIVLVLAVVMSVLPMIIGSTAGGGRKK
jgi:hypothetical protein